MQLPGKSLKKSTRDIYYSNKERKVPSGFDSTLLWLHNIRSMHNVGSAFRTADAMGIRGLLLSGYTPCPPRAELSKTALGAEETVSWFFKNDPEECVHMLKEQGYDLVSLEQTVVSIPIHEFVIPSSKKICLLLGNEITGVDESLIIQSQHVVEIPQYGNKHSLNVSVAAGIALFAFHELYRCR